jgi:PhnB protein
MPQLNAYLSFDGTCAEAMKFYARVLDAKLEALINLRSDGQRDARAGQPCRPTK